MPVGERGESLSGGQRQGVALARAVLGDPPILLLDEPTGAMDFSTEEGVRQRLARYAAGKTLVLVTHRTSLLDLVDRVVVIDGGKVVADGPKAQVFDALAQGKVGKVS
jgi:ATP-binding cassette subfamily C protein LapB